MSFKNKLGWFLLSMFAFVNIWFAKVNYFLADKNHAENIGCAVQGKHETETLWDRLSILQWGHVVVFLVVIVGFLFLAGYLIFDEKEVLTEAIVEKEE